MNNEQKDTITVLGTGSWGTTLAVLQARLGRRVTLLARDAGDAATLRAAGENARFLPGVPFPPGLRVTHDPAEALAGCGVLLLVVPAQTMRANIAALRAYLPDQADKGPLLVSGAKGLELGTLQRMSEVIRAELPAGYAPRVLSLSGPNMPSRWPPVNPPPPWSPPKTRRWPSRHKSRSRGPCSASTPTAI